MADLPIPFRAPMIRALLDDRKTQTRRAIKKLRGRYRRGVTEFGRSDTPGYDWHFRDDGKRWHDLRHAELLPLLRYQVGDRLWVKETYIPDPPSDDPSWDDNVCTYVEWSGCGSKIEDIPKALRDAAWTIYAAEAIRLSRLEPQSNRPALKSHSKVDRLTP